LRYGHDGLLQDFLKGRKKGKPTKEEKATHDD